MSKRFVNPALSALLCLVLLIWQLGIPVHAQPKPQTVLNAKNVLVLYSEDKSHPAHELTDQGIRAVFRSNKLVEVRLYNEYLDVSRFKGPAIAHAFADYLRRKYVGLKMDTIIAVYPAAVDFLLKEAIDVFPKTPIVAQVTRVYAENLEHSPRRRPITGTIMGDNITGVLDAALQMRPGTKRVALVGGTTPNDIYSEQLFRKGLEPYLEKLEIVDLTRLPMQEILTRVGSLPRDTIVLFSNMFTDGAGQNFVPQEALKLISRAANAPVFGLFDSYLGHGIVGGRLASFEKLGREDAALALRIMGGESPASIPFNEGQIYNDLYDWRQLRRWKLSEAALPKGSIVINKELTLWDFKYYIIGGLTFILLETALIIFLIVQRRRKKMAEQSLEQKTEELNQFFNVSLDLKCIANIDGYFLRLNPAWERTLGYTPEELMAKRFLDFVHPDDLDSTREAISSLASQQEIFLFGNRYRCKDGTYRWLEWSASPAGKLIYAAARDVTERKQAEEALEDRLQFEQLLSGLSGRFVNIPPDRVDSEIEDALRQILEFFQVDRCALLQVLPNESEWLITHVVAQEGAPPVPQGTRLSVSINPWGYDKLTRKREVVSFSRLDDLPAEANVDRQTWIEWGIRSNLVIPIIIDEPVNHIIAINSVKSECAWPEEYIPRLRLLGEILVNALQRRKAEEASQESERILRQNESDLRRLAGRLIYAQEEERSRLARELHDDLAQRLAVFAIDVGKLEQQWVDPPVPAQEQLREIEKNIFKISQDVHNLSRQLHPSILDDLGLIKAVESECTNFSRREGIEVVFNHENISTGIPKDVSLSLYRIIQEGLTNISKHACADHISVSLKGIDHDVLLSIQDDGIGFDSAEVKEKLGLGFSSMRERARLIHGEISIQSQQEKGTLITVRAPLTKEGE